jgi:hypothetical protein
MPCTPAKVRQVSGKHRLLPQSQRISQARNKHEQDHGWLPLDYMALQSKNINSQKLFSPTYSSLVFDRLCGLVVRVPGYRSRGPGSIPGTTRFSEK